MNKALSFFKAIGIVVIFLLIATPLTVKAGVAILNMITVSYDNSLEEVSPAVAYNSQRQEYLVVWYNDRAGNDDIRAQRLSSSGVLLGNPFYISAGSGADRWNPDVSYNSQSNEYLVVWQELSSGVNNIVGQRVTATGGITGSRINITNLGGSDDAEDPAVAYSVTSNKWLVAWSQNPGSGNNDIYGATIDSNGNPGTAFEISQAPTNDSCRNPDLAFNHHTNRYLVVWHQWENSNGKYNIHGRQVEGGGINWGNSFTILTDNSFNPTVAALPTSPTNGKFLVAMEYVDGANLDIYGIIVDEDNSVNPKFKIASDISTDESQPSVAGDERAQRYLVSWRYLIDPISWELTIKARTVSYDGTLVDNIVDFEGNKANYPAVANGPNGDFLTVWQDKPTGATTTGIFGHLWGNRLFMPLTIK